MAEFAVGGIYVAVRSMRSRVRPGECAHASTISTIAAGIERIVCENCGHLRLGFINEVVGPIDRYMFSRPADEEDAPVVEPYPFLEKSRLNLRTRSLASA